MIKKHPMGGGNSLGNSKSYIKKISILCLILFCVSELTLAKNIRNTRKQNLKRNQKNSSAKATTQNETPVNNTSNLLLTETENNALLEIKEAEIKKAEEEKKEILQAINDNVAKAKNSCIGIMDDLKNIQVLAGVSTGASAVGTLTSGGALASGIVKAGKDKKIYEDGDSLKEKKERYDDLNELDLKIDLEQDIEDLEKQVYERDRRYNRGTIQGYDDEALENRKKFVENNEKFVQQKKEDMLYAIEYNAKIRQNAIQKEKVLLSENKELQSYIDKNCSSCETENDFFTKCNEEEKRWEKIKTDIYTKCNEEWVKSNYDPSKKCSDIFEEKYKKELNEKFGKSNYDFSKTCVDMFEEKYKKELSDNCKICVDKERQITKNNRSIENFDSYYRNAGDALVDNYGFRSSRYEIGTDRGILTTSKLSSFIQKENFQQNPETEVFTDVESYIKQYRDPIKKIDAIDGYEKALENNQYYLAEALKKNQELHEDLELAKKLKKEKDTLEKEIPELEAQLTKNEAVSNLTGNLRTGLMAGSIATSATSTITSGVSIKKLDDLIEKMKECDRSVTTLKSSVNNAVAEEIDTDLTSYQNIIKSCSGFDTKNIKEIKGVMTASTIVGGVGTVAGTVGTITSAVANTKKTKENAKSTEEGRLNAKALNITANISAGIATGTSAGGIVLGAITLNKLSKNVDTAEQCEDALK